MSRRVLRAVESQPQNGRIYRLIVPWLGFPSETYGYVRDPRAAGSTKYPLSRLLRLAWDSVTAFSAAPLRLATWIGGISAVGCVALIVAVFVVEESGETVPGWASTMIVVTGLGAVQLICVGLLGEYVARIFTTIQARPPYSVGFDSHDEEQRDRDELMDVEPEPAGRPPAGT
jgi:dolichol-phosphate mannosyltransferase